MTTKPTLGGNLPRNEDANGLPAIESLLTGDRTWKDKRLAVVEFTTAKRIEKRDGDYYPVIQITHFEPLTTTATFDKGEALLMEHFTMRTDKATREEVVDKQTPLEGIDGDADTNLGDDGV
jgi:hypothetical protein